MAHSAHARPAAVYSATAGLVVLSICGFVTGLRLYMPHHRAAPAEAIQITTPAPAIPKVAQAPTDVALVEPAPTPPRSHAKRAEPDATTTDASALTGDQADVAALTPADRSTVAPSNDPDGPRADQSNFGSSDDQPRPGAPDAPDQDR